MRPAPGMFVWHLPCGLLLLGTIAVALLWMVGWHRYTFPRCCEPSPPVPALLRWLPLPRPAFCYSPRVCRDTLHTPAGMGTVVSRLYRVATPRAAYADLPLGPLWLNRYGSLFQFYRCARSLG